MPSRRSGIANKNTAFGYSNLNCVSHEDFSEIFADTKNARHILIAEIKGPEHPSLAELIVYVINRQSRLQETIVELTKTLGLCLACDGKLSWEAEQEADVLYQRANTFLSEIKKKRDHK